MAYFVKLFSLGWLVLYDFFIFEIAALRGQKSWPRFKEQRQGKHDITIKLQKIMAHFQRDLYENGWREAHQKVFGKNP